eukprot:2341376-Rhodomonas_salina.2
MALLWPRKALSVSLFPCARLPAFLTTGTPTLRQSRRLAPALSLSLHTLEWERVPRPDFFAEVTAPATTEEVLARSLEQAAAVWSLRRQTEWFRTRVEAQCSNLGQGRSVGCTASGRGNLETRDQVLRERTAG